MKKIHFCVVEKQWGKEGTWGPVVPCLIILYNSTDKAINYEYSIQKGHLVQRALVDETRCLYLQHWVHMLHRQLKVQC